MFHIICIGYFFVKKFLCPDDARPTTPPSSPQGNVTRYYYQVGRLQNPHEVIELDVTSLNGNSWCGIRQVVGSFFFSLFGWIYGQPQMVFQKKVLQGMMCIQIVWVDYNYMCSVFSGQILCVILSLSLSLCLIIMWFTLWIHKHFFLSGSW